MKYRHLPVFAAALITAWPTGGIAGNGQPTLIGWNNLGMHCMDDDYSVLSILPPFNTVDAQLIDAAGRLVKSGAGVTVTFEAVADPEGSIHRTAIGKTNFWDYVLPTYGATLAPDVGLFGTTRKYALGLLPDFPSANGVTSPAFDTAGRQRFLTLNITRFLPPPDASVSLEVSDDLQDWQPATLVTNTANTLKARDVVPANTTSQRFIRVKTSRP